MKAKEAIKEFELDNALMSEKKESDFEKVIERNCIAIKALEMAEWVASEVFCEDSVSDFFAELACRRLHEIGIVGKVNRSWTFDNKVLFAVRLYNVEKIIKKLETRIDEFIKKHPEKKNGAEVESIRELIHIIELEVEE